MVLGIRVESLENIFQHSSLVFLAIVVKSTSKYGRALRVLGFGGADSALDSPTPLHETKSNTPV